MSAWDKCCSDNVRTSGVRAGLVVVAAWQSDCVSDVLPVDKLLVVGVVPQGRVKSVPCSSVFQKNKLYYSSRVLRSIVQSKEVSY